VPSPMRGVSAFSASVMRLLKIRVTAYRRCLSDFIVDGTFQPRRARGRECDPLWDLFRGSFDRW